MQVLLNDVLTHLVETSLLQSLAVLGSNERMACAIASPQPWSCPGARISLCAGEWRELLLYEYAVAALEGLPKRLHRWC